MKVALRYCNECKRKTIQAEDVYLDTGWTPNISIELICPIKIYRRIEPGTKNT